MYIRDKVLIYVFFISGLRRAEFTKLREDDIDLNRRMLRVSRAKRQDKPKVEFIPLNDDDVRILSVWLKIKPKSLWLFPGRTTDESISGSTCWYRMSVIGKKAGIHVHPHGWRHHIASLMVQAGYKLEDVANFLGHKSMDVTRMYYSHLSEDFIKRTMTEYRKNIKT